MAGFDNGSKRRNTLSILREELQYEIIRQRDQGEAEIFRKQ
jgi:hypothetical protein